MKIGDFARAAGLGIDTIRYYEKIGLMPRVGRDGAGHRDYDAGDLRWAEFVTRLRTTGMPIRDMVRYARLRAEGDGTSAARAELLEAHRARLRTHIAELTDCLAVIDGKIADYRGQIGETT